MYTRAAYLKTTHSKKYSLHDGYAYIIPSNKNIS